ncbi:MAG TPA: DUF1003 domain-containing protein [Methylomirabilota bacterium]|jgi:uncharacterized membrane protein
MFHSDIIHGPVGELVKKRYPEWTTHPMICLSCLNRFRAEYVEDALEQQKGELSALEADVIRSLEEHEVVSRDIDGQTDCGLTTGERIADKVAEFGGSWRFILIFGGVLAGWIGVNSLMLMRTPFDPYPYILLNLVLSCLAAVQAPVIMMSQNRQEARDRRRAEHDYRVNLKAELEIRQLHWKIDQLLRHQWRRLLEIQQIQTDLMEELVHKPRRG